MMLQKLGMPVLFECYPIPDLCDIPVAKIHLNQTADIAGGGPLRSIGGASNK
jgi:hypothetical protein